jgi:hypothetical protein
VVQGAAASGGETFVELRLEVVARADAQPDSLSFVC